MDYQKKYFKYRNKYLVLKNQIAGNDTEKYIHPNRFLKNYSDYFNQFEKYLQRESTNLKDLWLVIGASNKGPDLRRFKEKYDISITYYHDDIDIYNTELISLSNEKNDIFDFLNCYLQNKFSKIIFDWSVSKFFDLPETIPKLLSLLEFDGELYINSFRDIRMNKIYMFKSDSLNKYYLYSISNEIIDLSDEEIINKLSHYSSDIAVKIMLSDELKDVYNLKQLCKKIDKDSALSFLDISGHISVKHRKIDYENYKEQIIHDYKEIIDWSKYNIELKYRERLYPNESIRDETNIFEFFIIKKI